MTNAESSYPTPEPNVSTDDEVLDGSSENIDNFAHPDLGSLKLPLQFGEFAIGDTHINPKSRDDIPAVLKGSQFIYTHEPARQRVTDNGTCYSRSASGRRPLLC